MNYVKSGKNACRNGKTKNFNLIRMKMLKQLNRELKLKPVPAFGFSRIAQTLYSNVKMN